MPLYTFYPTLQNGLCNTFQSFELDLDESIDERALHILEDHLSAATVVVYCGTRKIFTRSRIPPDLTLGPGVAPSFQMMIRA